MATRPGVALALVLWGSACADEPEAVPVGRFVDFETEDPMVSLCVGTPARLDRHVEQVHKFIEELVPGDLRVPLRVVEESICPGAACYSPGDRTIYVETVLGYSPNTTIEHELTHALVDRAWGLSVPSLNEGLAEALTSGDWYTPRPGAPVRAMLDQTPDELDYAELGRFVRFLIDSEGILKFKRLYQKSSTDSRAAIEANFKEVYGEDFEAIEAKYLAGGPRCRYQLDACDAASAESIGTAWSETFVISCLDPDAYGSRSGEQDSVAIQRTLRIETAGRYRVRVTVPQVEAYGVGFPSQVLLVRCGDCDEQKVRYLAPLEHELDLAAGLYTMLVSQGGDSLVTLEIELLDDGP